MDYREVLFFNNMLTPKIITVVYWLALAGSVIGGLVIMFSQSFFTGLLTVIGGVLFARIWCEMLIVMFKINEALQVIRTK